LNDVIRDTSSFWQSRRPATRILLRVTEYRLELTRCPDPACAELAEVAYRWTLGSTSGAFGMAQTICLRRHAFVLPTTWLADDPYEDLAA
jgi:hypothetical protein